MVSNKDFQKAVDLINQSTNVLMTSHTRPDGDACGSMRAMCDTLQSLGKEAHPLLLSPLPHWYEFLFEQKVPVLGNDIAKQQLHDGHFDNCDLVMIIDTNSYIQLPQFDEWLKETKTKVLVIDHHITGDGLGDINVVDTEAAAAGEIVLDLLNYAGWSITPGIANALFVAMATDTGWFRFGNCDSRIFHNAGELINAGARPDEIYLKLYHNVSPQRMKLMARMLESLELHYDNKIAIQTIMRKDFDDCAANGRDTENLIDECQRIGSVQMAALLIELSDGGFRCSLRSKGQVDVRHIAQRYGGGGHAMASGVNLPGPLENAKKLVVDAATQQLGVKS